MTRVTTLHVGHVRAPILMAGKALFAIRTASGVSVVAGCAFAVPVVVVGAQRGDRLVAIRAGGWRKRMLLMARLTLVIVGA